MHTIDEHNVADYLVEQRVLTPPVHVRLLTGGVSNLVVRVSDEQRDLVVKQARAQLRTKDPWFSDLERIHREVNAQQFLYERFPEHVPAVVFEDRENYVFAMTAAPPDAKVWKSQLLAGRADVTVMETAARLLSGLHDLPVAELEAFKDQTNFYQLRLEPYYYRMRDRLSALWRSMNLLIEETESLRTAFVHADFSPKNMLIADNQLTLVDYETVHLGDPAFDIGFFLAHLSLKCLYHGNHEDLWTHLISTFWQTYTACRQTHASEDFLVRSLRHLGANILVRIDGTSPVDYLDNPAHRESGREFANTLLSSPPTDWGQSVEMLKHLAKVP